MASDWPLLIPWRRSCSAIHAGCDSTGTLLWLVQGTAARYLSRRAQSKEYRMICNLSTAYRVVLLSMVGTVALQSARSYWYEVLRSCDVSDWTIPEQQSEPYVREQHPRENDKSRCANPAKTVANRRSPVKLYAVYGVQYGRCRGNTTQ